MNSLFSNDRPAGETETSSPKTAGSVLAKPQVWIIAAATLVVAVLIFSMLGQSQFQEKTRADLARISEQITRLQDQDREGESRLAALSQELAATRQELVDTRQTLGTTKQELGRMPRQIKLETEKTKVELAQAIAGKADSAQVEAVKQEAVTKIEQVSTDVGGVKNEVGTVKTDLVSTKADLDGTKRQLVDVRDSLTAAIARNSTELAELRRKGERDYYEFEIDKKNSWIGVEDIKLSLAKADAKNHKFNIRILVDDNQLEKKDRHINEPLQFLVGKSRLRYEVVINWVKKDQVGGYLSAPKDKLLSAENSGSR